MKLVHVFKDDPRNIAFVGYQGLPYRIALCGAKVRAPTPREKQHERFKHCEQCQMLLLVNPRK